MKFIILLLFALILTIAVALIKGCSTNDYQNYTSNIIGDKIVPGLKAEDVSKIIILCSDRKRILLRKIGDAWKVANVYNYNADAAKVETLLKSIQNSRIIQTVVNNKEALKQLDLNILKYKIDSNSSAAEVKLVTSSNSILADIAIGKRREEEIRSSGEKLYLGRYIKSSVYSPILFTDSQFVFTGLDKFAWIDHSFPKIKKIKSLKFLRNDKTVWVLARDSDKDKFYLGNDKNKKIRLNEREVSKITSILGNLEFHSVAKPGIGRIVSGMNAPKLFIAENFAGKRYVIAIGSREGDYYYVKVTTPEKDNIYKKWIYLINANRIDALMTERKDIEKKEVDYETSSFNMPIS